MDPVCYILKNETSGQKSVQSGGGAGPAGYNEMLKLLGYQHTSVSVAGGELLLPVHSSRKVPGQNVGSKTTQKFTLKRNSKITIDCTWESVAPLTLEECETLEAIPTPHERYALFMSPGFKRSKVDSRTSDPVRTRHTSTNVSLNDRQPSKGASEEHILTPPTSPQSEMTVGTSVIVPSFDLNQGGLYGVIRWIGQLPGVKGQIAGIELVRVV